MEVTRYHGKSFVRWYNTKVLEPPSYLPQCYDLGVYVDDVQAQAIMRTMDKDGNSAVQ